MSVLSFLNKDNWIQNHDAKDKDGKVVGCRRPEATQFCLMGALTRVDPDFEGSKQYQALLIRLGSTWVSEWNDSHTWEEVEAVIKELGL